MISDVTPFFWTKFTIRSATGSDHFAGEVRNQAEIARREGITRARVTQVIGMLQLAPEIQQHILSMPDTVPPAGDHGAGAAAYCTD